MVRILVVDDRDADRRMMRLVLGGMGHEVIEAVDGRQALEIAAASTPDLVLSDILMPRMDGFALCRAMKESPVLRRVPFVFVTAAYAEPRYREFASEVGAVQTLLKPFEAAELRRVVEQALSQGADSGATQRLASLDALAFHEKHAEVVATKLEQQVLELEQANQLLRGSEAHARGLLTAVIQTIGNLVEHRDPYTAGHERRVGELAGALGVALGLSPHEVEGLRIAGLLHDVGKVAIPAELLVKPARLNPAELAIVRTHAETGHVILSHISFPWPVAEVALQHHERLDGSGYPRGLIGDDILMEARLMAVADVVEAMSSHRPFRPALGIEAALAEMESGRGRVYDARVVDACLHLFREGGFAFT